MAYKYEEPLTKKFNEEYRAGRISNLDLLNELQEVYIKAKAFDEIKKLRNSYYTYSKRDSGTPITVLDAKTFGREVSHLINKNGYMEDK